MGKMMFNGIDYSGSGSSQLSQLNDVNLNTPQNGQTLKYNSETQKWVNADGSYRTIHSTLKVYRTLDSYETTISIYDDSDTLLYTKVINAGNYYGYFESITEYFEVSGVTNTITMYGDGTDADAPQNWLHIIINEQSYNLGNTVRNPSYPLDLSVDSSVKTGAAISGIGDIPDVDLTNLQDGQVIKWDDTLGKWVNADVGGGSSGVELTGNLASGATTLVFNDSAITTDSTIDYYPSVFGVHPINAVATTGTLTLTFRPRAEALSVKVVIS